MIETIDGRDVGSAGCLDAPATPLRLVRAALGHLSPLAGADGSSRLAEVDDASLIDILQVLRRLRAVTGAVEARVQVVFDESQRAAAAERGVPRRDQGKDVADQIALARGISAHAAANHLALVKGLVHELPETMSKLASGAIKEETALGVARETVCLTREDRAIVDQRVAPRLNERTRRQHAESMTRAESARVDAGSVVARIRKAEAERCVTVRPAPDAMVYLTGLMPVKDGVAAYAALSKLADQARAAGDRRTRGQIMADELLTRLTGVSKADLIPVEVQLVMPAETLLRESAASDGSSDAGPAGDEGERPGRIGQHIIPAALCREIALIPDEKAKRWVRRVFTDPVSGEVRAVDERRRFFSGALRQAIVLRDQLCRTCGAPIRQIDHVRGHAGEGGATSMTDGQGLCQRCNLTKALPGWSSRAIEVEGHHVVVTRTPTGHRYASHPPPPLLSEPETASCGAPSPGVEERVAARAECAPHPECAAPGRPRRRRPEIVWGRTTILRE